LVANERRSAAQRCGGGVGVDVDEEAERSQETTNESQEALQTNQKLEEEKRERLI